jgi:hypothetical protein
MDENGESRVGFQEILKYCMKGGKMRGRKYFGLLIMLLFAFVTLFAPTGAEGTTYGPTYGTDDNGNTWAVTAIVDLAGTCGPDKRGNSFPCSTFQWDIAPPAETGGNVIRAVVNVPAGGCLQILEPSENAVKIDDCDTSTKHLCEPYIAELDALIFNSLKGTADPWDHTMIAVYMAPSSIRDTTLLLVTDWGYVYVPTKGPDCCGDATQSQSSVLYNAPSDFSFIYPNNDPTGASGNIAVQYAVCDENDLGTPVDPGPDPDEPYTKFDVLYFCRGSTDSYNRNTCVEAQIAGPDYAFIAYAKHVIFGHGDQFWYGPAVTPPSDWQTRALFEGCTTPDSFTCYSGDVCAWKKDGDVCDVTQEDAPVTSVSQYYFNNSIVFPDDWAWICQNRISQSTCSVIYWSDFTMINRFSWGSAYKWPWGTQ